MLTTACCLVVGLGLGLDLVSGWLVVMHTFLYNLPFDNHMRPLKCGVFTSIRTDTFGFTIRETKFLILCSQVKLESVEL